MRSYSTRMQMVPLLRVRLGPLPLDEKSPSGEGLSGEKPFRAPGDTRGTDPCQRVGARASRGPGAKSCDVAIIQ